MRALILLLVPAIALADPRADAEKRFRIGEKAYKAQNFAAAAEHFEEAYKIIPLPELAFSAAQAHRKQYRVDRKIERAQRAVELYRIYLDAVKSGGQVGAAADGLDAMERELARYGTAKGGSLGTDVERTTIIVNPELVTERTGEMLVADTPDAENAKIVVLLDGKPAPVYEKIDVEPGPHKIHVEVEGYLPADASERAVKGSNTTANVQLEPKPAKVTVKAVRGHGDEIAMLTICRCCDFRRRISRGEQGLSSQPLGRKSLGEPFDVFAIATHLLRLAEIEMLNVSCRPSIGDMDEHDGRAAKSRELTHVIEDALVVTGVLDWNEDAMVHVRRATRGTSGTRATR